MNLSMGPNVTSEKVEIMDWGPQHEKQVILAEKEKTNKLRRLKIPLKKVPQTASIF